MSNIQGTNVSSPIVPFTTSDQFPTHDAQYGKGGFRSVNTIEDRDNITTFRKDPGMFVYVRSDGKLYIYNQNNTWSEYIEENRDYNQSTGSMGYKVLVSTESFTNQVAQQNTIYEIREVFDLGGSTFSIPSNSILAFNGGVVKNATLSADNLLILARDEEKIFDHVAITGTLKNWYVTPEWFGAVKDYYTDNQNPTDDAAAIQAALDCGTNVKFANYGNSYYTRGGIHLKTSYQTLFRDVSSVGTKGAPHGIISFHPEADESPLFVIDSPAHDVYFLNLRIINIGDLDPNQDTESKRFRGIKISCVYNSPADKDIAIRECQFIGGKYQVDLHGRGCEFTDNMVGACRGVIRANWDDQYQTGNHPAAAGQRAIRIQNNRLHSIASTDTYPAIYIESGHAIGMVIQDNVWDNGRGAFLGANNELWNLLMTNNLIQLNAFNITSMLSFNGGIYNSVISNNNFSNYRYYDSSAQEWKGYWANESYPTMICDIHTSCKNLIFENNQCMLTNRFGVVFSNCAVDSSKFVNNYFSFFRNGQSIADSSAFYFAKDSSNAYNLNALTNSVISGNMSQDTDAGYNTYTISTYSAFDAYKNIIEYNKAYKQDGTLVANPFTNNIRLYDSVISLENGITASDDMSNWIKSFNPWPVSNNGVISWFNGTGWKDAFGFTSARHVGSHRPTLTQDDYGFQFYDTTLGRYICWSGVGWTNLDGSPLIYSVTYNLTHVISSNTATTISVNAAYSTTLTPSTPTFNITDVKVIMGGLFDITQVVYSSQTNIISIPTVTGDLVISAREIGIS